MVTKIGLDHLGLVRGIEMPRPARSGKDWYQLLGLRAVTGALLADVDGVCDPAECNDRLLLGLKGAMSEAELHLLKPAAAQPQCPATAPLGVRGMRLRGTDRQLPIHPLERLRDGCA